MSDTATTSAPGKKNTLATLLAIIGCFAIFLFILFVAYLPQKPEPISQGNLSPEERKAKLLELRANEKKAATAYAWVDQSKGTVQIPIDEAMRLTVQDIQARK